MAKEDETLCLQDAQRFANRDETRAATLGDLLWKDFGVATVVTRDDAVTQVLDDMGDGTVVGNLRSDGTTSNC